MGALLTKNYSVQPENEYEGEVWRYLASENIEKYQPVCYGFDANGNLVMSKIHSAAENDHYLGVCLEDVQTFNYGKVLTKGHCFIKRLTTYMPNNPTEILLNNLTHNTNNVDKYINFRDNGNLSANYETQQRKIRFDAGSGNTWILTLKSSEFEHTTYSLYDRLLLWVGNDGEVWTKADITGWKSTTSTSEYGSTAPGSSSTPKNVCPNYSSSTPQVININSRWLRFNFYADGSSHYDGWDIELKTSDYSPNNTALDVPVNTPLYIDENDGNATTTPQSTWALNKILGRVILPTASNDKVKIRINN